MRIHCRTNLRVVFVILASCSLINCASLNKRECLAGDWVGIGKADGLRGKIADERLVSHVKACSKHSVNLDKEMYKFGHSEGLKGYCTIENGHDVATDFVMDGKKAYNNVCPEELQSGFLEGYVSGLKLNLDMVYQGLNLEEEKLESSRGAYLILKVLNSSKADSVEEDMDDADDAIRDKKNTIDTTIKEIEKWLLVVPELEELLQ